MAEEEYFFDFDNELFLNIIKKKIDQLGFYCVQGMGGMNIEKNKLKLSNYQGDFVVYCDDVTENKNLIQIETKLLDYKDNDGLFFLRRNNIKIEWGSGYFDEDFKNIFLIPENEFVLPHKGKRKIRFKFYIVKSGSVFKKGKTLEENILFETTTFYFIDYNRLGYLDKATKVDDIDSGTIQLGLALANATGSIGKAELGKIKQWIEDKNKWGLNEFYHPELLDDQENIKKKAYYNQLLKDSFDKIREKKLTLSRIVKKINENAFLNEKYDAINLLLNIVSADNKLGKEENELLTKIVRSLEVDETEFNKMKEKVIATVDVIDEDETDETLFNINAKMSKDEKCKLLRKEYSRWNAQTNNSDIKIKTRAKRMVEIAARLRSKYKC